MEDPRSPLVGHLERDGGALQIVRDAAGQTFWQPPQNTRAWKRLTSDGKGLVSHLQALATNRQYMDEAIEEHIAAARDEGVSWEIIGWSVGMTGEGARQRYGEGVL